MVIHPERGAEWHTAQLMPLPLTVSCFSKIQIGFTFLVPAYLGSPGQRAIKRVCVCVCACVRACVCVCVFVFVLPPIEKKSLALVTTTRLGPRYAVLPRHCCCEKMSQLVHIYQSHASESFATQCGMNACVRLYNTTLHVGGMA